MASTTAIDRIKARFGGAPVRGVPARKLPKPRKGEVRAMGPAGMTFYGNADIPKLIPDRASGQGRNTALSGHRGRASARSAGLATSASSQGGVGGLLDLMNSPEFQQYNDSYAPNLEAARSAIQNSYAQAMSEIQKREGLSQQLTDAYPGQINATFDYAGGQLNTFAQQAQADSQAALGAGQPMLSTAEGNVAPIQAANAANRASRLADVPLLQATAQGVYSQQRQDVETQRGQALADIAAQEASMRASREGSLSDAQGALIDAYNQDQSNTTGDPEGPGGAKAPIFGANEYNSDRGRYMLKYNPRLVDYIINNANGHNRSRQAYLEMSRRINKNRGKLDAAKLAQIAADVFRTYPGQAEAISLAMAQAGA